MVQKLIFIALFLLGSVVGWLVVYFVRKYKEHSPKALRDTIVLFLGGGCMDLLLSLIDKQTALYAFAAYLIGFGVAFFLHWIYQFVVAKLPLRNIWILAANMICSQVVVFPKRSKKPGSWNVIN